MKFLSKSKDGGPESTVDAYWLLEIKSLLSVALLKFGLGSRDAYHSHAFNSLNWVLKGSTVEGVLSPVNGLVEYVTRLPRLKPFFTWRSTFHKVKSYGTSWVLSIRGPWQKNWLEFVPGEGYRALEHGRGVVKEGFTGDDAAWLLWLSPKDFHHRLGGLP